VATRLGAGEGQKRFVLTWAGDHGKTERATVERGPDRKPIKPLRKSCPSCAKPAGTGIGLGELPPTSGAPVLPRTLGAPPW